MRFLLQIRPLGDAYLKGKVWVSDLMVQEKTPLRINIAGANEFGPGEIWVDGNIWSEIV